MISADFCCVKIMGAGGKVFYQLLYLNYLNPETKLILLHSEAPCCRFCTAAFSV